MLLVLTADVAFWYCSALFWSSSAAAGASSSVSTTKSNNATRLAGRHMKASMMLPAELRNVSQHYRIAIVPDDNYWIPCNNKSTIEHEPTYRRTCALYNGFAFSGKQTLPGPVAIIDRLNNSLAAEITFFAGSEAEVMQHLASHLNFSYTLVLAQLQETSSENSKTDGGAGGGGGYEDDAFQSSAPTALPEMLRLYEVDLIGTVALGDDDSSDLKNLFPFDFDSLVVIAKKVNLHTYVNIRLTRTNGWKVLTSGFWSLLEPKVWGMYLLTLGYVAVLSALTIAVYRLHHNDYYLLKEERNFMSWTNTRQITTLMMKIPYEALCWALCWGANTDIDFEEHMLHVPSSYQLIKASWWIGSRCFWALAVTNLWSIYTRPTFDMPFRSLEDLYDQGGVLSVWSDHTIMASLQSAPNDSALGLLYSRMQSLKGSERDMAFVRNRRDFMRALELGYGGVTWQSLFESASYLKNYNKAFTLMSSAFSFTVRADDERKEFLNFGLETMAGAGIVEHIYQKYFDGLYSDRMVEKDQASTTTTVKDLAIHWFTIIPWFLPYTLLIPATATIMIEFLVNYLCNERPYNNRRRHHKEEYGSGNGFYRYFRWHQALAAALANVVARNNDEKNFSNKARLSDVALDLMELKAANRSGSAAHDHDNNSASEQEIHSASTATTDEVAESRLTFRPQHRQWKR